MTGTNGKGDAADTVLQDGVFASERLRSARVLLFDLDGTLRHSRPAANTVMWEFVAGFDLGREIPHRHQSARWVHSYWAMSQDLLDDTKAYPQEDEFWLNYAHRFLSNLGCSPEQTRALAPQTHAYMQGHYHPQNWVDPETPRVLRALQQAGYTLGLVSNRTDPCQAELEQLGLDSFFELVLVAGEVSAWKPDARIFHVALERLGAAPEKTLYIGDNYYADIIGAESAGLLPVLVDPEGIFPDASCPVVGDIVGLHTLLLPPGAL